MLLKISLFVVGGVVVWVYERVRDRILLAQFRKRLSDVLGEAVKLEARKKNKAARDTINTATYNNRVN